MSEGSAARDPALTASENRAGRRAVGRSGPIWTAALVRLGWAHTVLGGATSTAARGGRHPLVGALAILGAAALGVACHASQSDPPTSAVASGAASASSAGYVRLTRGAHPLARPEFDVGPLDPDRRIANLAIVFKLSPQQETDRDALLAAQLDRTSPSYHKWLKPEEYAARFGAKASDIARTRAWLAQEGLEPRATSRLAARVNFAGRVADLQTAFRTDMRVYQVGDQIHYAMSTAPAIPSALSDIVLAVHNTHDFYARPSPVRSTTVPLAVCPPGDVDCRVPGFGLAPRDWATIYDVTPLYATGVAGAPLDGSGASIAIVGLSQISLSDVNTFRATYGLPAADIMEVQVPDTGAATASPVDAEEAMLDTEWSGGIAPGASVKYVFTGEDDLNIDDAAYYVIEQDMAPILSESFGQCEFDQTPSDADELGVYGSAANLLGITYIAGAGDSDATGCLAGQAKPSLYSGLYVNLPASFPGVTAVGGTEFPPNALAFDCNGVATGYATAEQVWNGTGPGGGNPTGGGGGISAVFAAPPYQVTPCTTVGKLPPLPVGLDVSASSVSLTAMRQVPDVALTADDNHYPYFIECTPATADSGRPAGCSSTGGHPVVLAVGGTSAGTPSFAGVLALAYQATGGRLGNINPSLYAINTTTPQAFHDITTGNNLVACTPDRDPGCPAICPVQGFGDGGGPTADSVESCYGYEAAPGYDCASGLGSIDAANLVRTWAGVAPTTTTLTAIPSMITEGASVTFVATVGATTTAAFGGDVSFTYRSYGPTFFLPESGYFAASSSYALGSGPVAVTSMGTATLTTALLAGLVRPGAQYVDVGAAYSGDAHHLASTSATVRVSFTGVDLCIPQASANVGPGGSIAYSAVGGIEPIDWYTILALDSTCDKSENCSKIDTLTGAFTAGPEAGYVMIEAIDKGGAMALSFVTVGSSGTPPPWGAETPTSCPSGDASEAGDAEEAEDAGAPEDAAVSADVTSGPSAADGGSAVGDGGSVTPDAGAAEDATIGEDAAIWGQPAVDSGSAVGFDGWPSTPCDSGASHRSSDAGEGDAGPVQSPQTGTSGCGCDTAGRERSPVGEFGAILVGFGLIARRTGKKRIVDTCVRRARRRAA
ncbi:MAG: protease pro-enzyme activation domain-containing protein [Polyangiaceae bacterium]